MSTTHNKEKPLGVKSQRGRRRKRRGKVMAHEEKPGPLATLSCDFREQLEKNEMADEQENFQDAEPGPSDANTDLQNALADCEMAIKRFFNNDLDTAMGIMQSRSGTSLYHSLGVSIFEFIPAVLTLDSAQVGRAIQSLKKTVALCNQHRRTYTIVQTIGTMILKTNYATLTDLEAHAQLCYAESMLLQAALCVIDGEDLAGFLRATIKIKSCYNIYKECSRILEKKKWESVASRRHFQSGVRFGSAIFNVMIALLPPRIITLLEFAGFSGDKEAGLAELQAGAQEAGLRGVLCEIALLAHHLVVSHFAGATPNYALCQKILETQLKVYPEGVWFLLFEGRLQLLRGRCALAAATYHRVAETPHLWPQLRHLCYWELMWANAMMMDWRTAAGFAGRLIEESSWSRTMYCYAKAALLLQLGEDCTSAERNHAADLLKAAPLYRMKIAGKSLPMEKWVSKRCARHAAQGGQLLLPAVELICLWNMMSALGAAVPTLQSLIKQIDTASEILDREDRRWPTALMVDNRALLFYLRGCCLSTLGMQRLAIQEFDHVVSMKDAIKMDNFLVPYALVEAATCYYNLGEVDRAVRIWQDTRKGYSNYALESRLQFRIHSKLQMARSGIAPDPSQAGCSRDLPVLPSHPGLLALADKPSQKLKPLD